MNTTQEWRDEVIKKHLKEVEDEYQMGGLSDGLYGDYATEVAKRTLDTHTAHLVERIEKYAGKVFGVEVIVTPDLENKEYRAGFEAGKKFMKDQAIDIVKK